MHIAFFLIPKREVVYVTPRMTLRRAIELMHGHGYNAVPVVDDDGRYAGTFSEGDALRYLVENPEHPFESVHTIRVGDVRWYKNHAAVRIDARIEDLISLATEQNFVPVVDARDIFIGIVRRKEIMEYCARLLAEGHAFRQSFAAPRPEPSEDSRGRTHA
ncbi:MAG: Inosine-5'-monophosphate dehydrogenase [Brockia lithotrophica]|uniref:Inosine-5'-monophosphate dehydrogenase n=1 Tax=Brockia lithotrophica TaxID=933949 RepID=A0A2T5G7K8_9BACL|nr:CBS domain-containing protein [Brockia lithotrophica]PTQ52171.1 MAG: Inosine-5'-monophosphate dehydrogenase [Brockia lithotrophica]